MNHNKRKKELSDTIPASLLTEMALPRMSKSARIAEQNLNAARVLIPGTVEKLIPSPCPNQPEKAQIAIEGDHGYRDLRIKLHAHRYGLCLCSPNEPNDQTDDQ
jgi:hypothetical protein